MEWACLQLVARRTTLSALCLLWLALAPQLSATGVSTPQSTVAFGSVAVGSSGTQTLSFTVSPVVTLGNVSVVTQGSPNLDFTQVPAGTTCANGTTGTVCTVEVQFKPLSPGLRLGAVVLSDQSGNTLITVFLNGVGTGPVVAFPPGTMSTVVGGTKAGQTVGLSYPNGVAVDAAGNIYAASTYVSTVYKVTPAGVATKIAGGNGGGYFGDGGLATAAKLYYPTTVRLDGAGNIYITDDGNNVVRMITPAGIISTVAGLAPGSSVCSQAIDQWGDGCPATQASLDFFDSYYGEGGTTSDASGNLYIADTANNLIRKVDATTGLISIFAGTGAAGYSGDGGPATAAQLNNPDLGGFDSAGNLYIADLYNNVIRKVTPGGTISTVAGTGQYGHSGDGYPAVSAQLGFPYMVVADAAGNLYITDSGNFTEGDQNEVIRKVDAVTGVITTVAGSVPSSGYSGDGGPATSAQMWGPVDVAVDGQGNLYIADDYNHAIRKVTVSVAPSLIFPVTPYNTMSAAQYVGVDNIGNAALDINSITAAANFGIGGSSNSCTLGNLASAASCLLGIEFSPSSTGAIAGSVLVKDNAVPSTQMISVQGTGNLGCQFTLHSTVTGQSTQSSDMPPVAYYGDTVTISGCSAPHHSVIISSLATLGLKSSLIAGTVTFKGIESVAVKFTAITGGLLYPTLYWNSSATHVLARPISVEANSPTWVYAQYPPVADKIKLSLAPGSAPMAFAYDLLPPTGGYTITNAANVDVTSSSAPTNNLLIGAYTIAPSPSKLEAYGRLGYYNITPVPGTLTVEPNNAYGVFAKVRPTVTVVVLGPVKIGMPVTKTVMVSNATGETLNIAASLPAGTPFSASAAPACATTPGVLPGGMCTLTITFTPSVSGLVKATLNITAVDANNDAFTSQMYSGAAVNLEGVGLP